VECSERKTKFNFQLLDIVDFDGLVSYAILILSFSFFLPSFLEKKASKNLKYAKKGDKKTFKKSQK